MVIGLFHGALFLRLKVICFQFINKCEDFEVGNPVVLGRGSEPAKGS